MSNLLSLVCGMCEAKRDHNLGMHEWHTYFSKSFEGCIKKLEVKPPKPCALCGGPAHSGPCYYSDGVTP